MSDKLMSGSAHFAFGRNWKSYGALIDDHRIAAAQASISELCEEVDGKTFLDIGSGSGLFSLAALRLGTARLLAVDIDEASVETTERTLAGMTGWECRRISVFDLPGAVAERFDVVYSWGVLHHTGNLRLALESAAQMVAPGGVFTFSIYERTPLCGLWKIEKRLYSRSPRIVQRAALLLYAAALAAGRALTFRPISKPPSRGMDRHHDNHDWLGGYPYESSTFDQLDPIMTALGFRCTLHRPVKVKALGLLGTGCSEYSYRRAE